MSMSLRSFTMRCLPECVRILLTSSQEPFGTVKLFRNRRTAVQTVFLLRWLPLASLRTDGNSRPSLEFGHFQTSSKAFFPKTPRPRFRLQASPLSRSLRSKGRITDSMGLFQGFCRLSAPICTDRADQLKSEALSFSASVTLRHRTCVSSKQACNQHVP